MNIKEMCKRIFEERLSKDCLLPDDEILKYLEINEVKKIWENCIKNEKYFTAVELGKKYYEISKTEEAILLAQKAADEFYIRKFRNESVTYLINQLPSWIYFSCSFSIFKEIANRILEYIDFSMGSIPQLMLRIPYPYLLNIKDEIDYKKAIENVTEFHKTLDRVIDILIKIAKIRNFDIYNIFNLETVKRIFLSNYKCLIENRWIYKIGFPKSLAKLITPDQLNLLEKEKIIDVYKLIRNALETGKTEYLTLFEILKKYGMKVNEILDLFFFFDDFETWKSEDKPTSWLIDVCNEYRDSSICTEIARFLIKKEKYKEVLGILEYIDDKKLKQKILEKVK